MKKTCITQRVILLFLVAVILGVTSSPAQASGPAFTGLAAKADTAETVYLNPAGMTRMKAPAWYGNPQVMYTESKTEFSVSSGGKQSIEDDGFIFLPGLYYVRPLNEKWSVGIGPNAATGLGTTYNDSWPGRYLVEEWSQIMIGLVPSVAYRVNDKLSIGASLSINYSRFTLDKAIFNGPGQPDGDFEFESDGFGVGGNVGILYEINDQTRFGIVYRSEVEAETEGRPDISGLSNARRTLLENAGFLNEDITLDTNTPQAMQAGIYHDFRNGWTVSVDGLWLDFSEWAIDNITIGDTSISQDKDSNYQDIWGVSLGSTYALQPDWSLRSGVLYLSPGLDDGDRTIFSRFDEIWAVGGGVEHEFKSKRTLALDVTYFQFGDGEFASPNVPVVGTISGEYETNYGVLLSVATSF